MKKTIIVLMLHSIPFILFSIEDTDADSVRFRSNLSVLNLQQKTGQFIKLLIDL